MRYFLTTVADRPVRAGGRTFQFDPVALRGGSWVGVLALDEESGASILSGSAHPSVSEISQTAYEAEKKKVSNSVASSAEPQRPLAPTHTLVPAALADRAGVVPTGPHSPAVSGGPGMAVTANHENYGQTHSAVSLLTTKSNPPADPLLAESGPRGRF
jgi:hypothetical protein